ncbi:sensor histidine kinase [Blastococcus tunisiensis]|uniref:histidine kinase n=1 Tax=Blastococcus tunisiensis TaxID=1798228 RepID=A0A1I2KHE8_9ACTN|nr:HAMP domain-containing sensor histidine kinase [Blastococcus sp. DSM 46838]SFF65709.1 Signal transduction histidine kinase [Blastococcus sp. DSM 46838]
MILAQHTSPARWSGFLPAAVRRARARLRRGGARAAEPERPSSEDVLVRALCHDMRGSLACLESALRHLGRTDPALSDVLELAQAQAAHLTSLLRTAEVTGGAAPRRPRDGQRLTDVLAASVAASGLPRAQLTVDLDETSEHVLVGDARLQRILVNLLENAHRHGRGAPVHLGVTSGGGWVECAVTQAGVPAQLVIGHLTTTRPPADLTGLGLWSVQQQVRQLGGWIVWEEHGGALTLRVQLPDH